MSIGSDFLLFSIKFYSYLEKRCCKESYLCVDSLVNDIQYDYRGYYYFFKRDSFLKVYKNWIFKSDNFWWPEDATE